MVFFFSFRSRFHAGDDAAGLLGGVAQRVLEKWSVETGVGLFESLMSL